MLLSIMSKYHTPQRYRHISVFQLAEASLLRMLVLFSAIDMPNITITREEAIRRRGFDDIDWLVIKLLAYREKYVRRYGNEIFISMK